MCLSGLDLIWVSDTYPGPGEVLYTPVLAASVSGFI